MDKLPNEILTHVFENLHLFQKQECMLVCSRWSNIISSTNLYSTAYITKNFTFDKLTKTLDDNPSYRSQILHLIVYDDIPLTLNYQQVLDYFPSLCLIHIDNSAFLFENTHNELINPNAWRDNIKTIEQYSGFEFGKNLLFSEGYIALTKLVVRCPVFDARSATILANSPNINDLTIIEAEISVWYLNLLNKSLRALNTLTLDQVVLNTNDKSSEAILTSQLTTLFINFKYTTDNVVVKWLKYITNNCPLLTRFRFIFPCGRFFKFQDETNITNNGLIPLLIKVGNQLNHLDITCSCGLKTILQTLSTFEHNIQILHFRVLFSIVRKPFTRLDGLGSFINHFTMIINSVSRLKEFGLKDLQVLKNLRVGYMDWRQTGYTFLSLNELLDSCPDSLTSLEIYDFRLYSLGTNSLYYSLKKLSIHSKAISQSVYEFISNSLPNLKYLTIDLRDNFETDTIMLKDKNLYYLEISVNDNCLLQLNILVNGTSQYYRVGTYKSLDFYSTTLSIDRSRRLIKKVNSEKIRKSEKIISVTCNSVNTVVINNKLAF